MAFTDLSEGILEEFADAQGRASIYERVGLAGQAKGKMFRLNVGRRKYKTRKDKGTYRTSAEHRKEVRAAQCARRYERLKADPARWANIQRLARKYAAKKRVKQREQKRVLALLEA